MQILACALLLILILLAIRARFLSFRAQTPANYADSGPSFVPQEHLNGDIAATGLIYGPTGRVSSSFVARMVGAWDGDKGTLSEHFTFSNGRTQLRTWHLTLGPDNTFSATADDIVGEAKGVVSGATVMLRYRLVLPPEAGGHRLNVTDWMYLTADGTIMNRSEMRLFGIKVAELVAQFRPRGKV